MISVSKGQERSRGGRWSWALIESCTIFRFSSSTAAFRTLSLWLCSAQLVERTISEIRKLLRMAGSPSPKHRSSGGGSVTVLSVFTGRSWWTSYSCFDQAEEGWSSVTETYQKRGNLSHIYSKNRLLIGVRWHVLIPHPFFKYSNERQMNIWNHRE